MSATGVVVELFAALVVAVGFHVVGSVIILRRHGRMQRKTRSRCDCRESQEYYSCFSHLPPWGATLPDLAVCSRVRGAVKWDTAQAVKMGNAPAPACQRGRQSPAPRLDRQPAAPVLDHQEAAGHPTQVREMGYARLRARDPEQQLQRSI